MSLRAQLLQHSRVGGLRIASGGIRTQPIGWLLQVEATPCIDIIALLLS
jgi:hypothetical protein